MAFSKVVVEDKIEVLELGQLQVRTKTTVLEDSVELSSAFHRHTVVLVRTCICPSSKTSILSSTTTLLNAIAFLLCY